MFGERSKIVWKYDTQTQIMSINVQDGPEEELILMRREEGVGMKFVNLPVQKILTCVKKKRLCQLPTNNFSRLPLTGPKMSTY